MGNLINQYREESDPRDGIELPDIRYVAQAAPPTAENNFNNEFNWEDQGVTFPTTAREAIDNINEEREAVGLPTSETAGADDPSPNFDRPTPVAEEPIETTDVPFTPVQVGNAPREFNPQEEAANISNNVYGTIGEAQLDGAVLPIYYPSSGSDDIIRASKNFNNTVFDRSRNLGKEIVNIIQPQQPLYIPPGMAKKLQQVSPTESATPFQGHNRETLDGMGSGTNSVNVFLNAYSTWFGGGSERSGYVFDTNEPEENRTARSFAPFAGLRRAFEKFKTDPGGAITGLVPMLFNPFSANSLSFRGSQWGDYPGGLLGGLTYAVDLDENPLLGGMTDLIYKIQGRKTDADGLNIVQAARGRDYNFSAVRRVNADGTVENPLSVFAGEHTKEPTTIGELRNRSWLWRLVVPFGLSDDIKIKTPDNLVGSLEFGTGVVLDMGASLLTGGLLDGGLEGIEKWKQSRNVREVTPAFTPAHVPPEPKPIGISTVVDSRGATAEIPAVTDLSNYKGTPIAPDNQYAPKVTDSGTIVRSPLTDIGTDVKTPQIVNPGSILNDNPVPKVADLPEDVDLAGKVGAQANRTSELVAKLDEEAEATAKVLDEVETIPDVGRQVDFSIEPLPDNFRPLAKVENEAAEPQLATIRVYHGTVVNNPAIHTEDVFNGAARSELGVGMHLTTNKPVAELYADAPAQINLPAVTTRPYKESGTVHEYVVDPSILKIVNSTDALDPAIKTRMIGRMQAFGINEEEVFKAVRESNDYTELFEKTTMAQYPFNEANALNIQRLLTAEIMDSGVDGLKHGDGQYVIYRPNYLIHSGAEPMLDANLSALGKKISRMNADAHALSQFPNSTLAKRNYAESRLSVFQQKAYETRKVAQEANEELETLSTDLARMFNDAKPKKDVEVPETVNGKGGKATKESVSNKDAVRTVAKSDVAQRLERLHALHEATSKKQKTVRGTVEAAQAKVAAIIDVKNVMYASKTQALNPSKFNAFESFLAAQFNMKRKALDTALGLTEAGAVRVNLREAGTIAQGIVDDLVRLRMSAAIKGLSKRIYELIPEDRASRQAANRLRLDIIEIGSIPKLQATYGMMPGARRFNAERYKKLVDTLKGLGISNKEIQELIQLSTEISTKMDEMRLVGNALGLDIGKEEMLGYLTRVMTPELSKWIDVTEAKGFSSLTDLSAKGGGGHGGVIEGSRVSSHLVPEDLTILSNKTGFTESELKEMLSDGSLTRALMDTLPDEKLNKLVDTHVLSKVSMTTNELSDFIIAKYGDKLPMQVSKGTLPVFIDDPELITDYYVKYLKDQTYKSNVAKRIVSDGLNNGWVFPKAKFDSLDAAAKENFVKLDAATVRRYYPTYKETADLYVHKTVDQQWRSMMAMINDPLTMNTLHQNIKSFGGFFNQAILTNPTYPARILYDSFRSFYAAGGNLLRFHEGWRDIATIMRKESIDHLNNTDAIYRGVGGKLVTEQELFRQFIALFGTDYAPLTTATKLNKRGHFKNILNLPRGVAYATEMVKKIGVMEGGKEFLSLAKGVQEDLFAELATVATFFETSSKWALIKSWMSDSKFNKITQNVTQLGVPAPNPKTLQDAALVIEDYFTAWNDVGTGSRLINDTVRPFAVYAIWNSPAQIRQILRRPHEFENYIRIQSFLNRDFNQEDKHVEWTLPQFIKDNRPVALWKDKNGNWVTVLPTSWDSRADFFASGERTVTQVYKDAGIITGNAPEQYKQILNEEKDLPLFGDYIKEAAPYIKTFVSLVTGRDALSGKEIKGELETGSRTGLPWQAEYLLSTYPPFDAMMRTNPFELLGTPEFRDPKTLEVIIPGRPGLLGNRRVDYDPSKYQNTWGAVNILRRIGLNIKIIDTARNLQYNYSKAERAYNLLKSDIGSLQKELTLMDMKGERETYTLEWQQKQKQFETKVYQLMYMQKDLMVMQEYMKYRNVKPTEVIKFIDQETLRQVQERVGDKLIIELMDEIQQYNKYLSTGEK